MVGVAQLVELRVVVPAAAGSSPVAHPSCSARMSAFLVRGGADLRRDRADGVEGGPVLVLRGELAEDVVVERAAGAGAGSGVRRGVLRVLAAEEPGRER